MTYDLLTGFLMVRCHLVGLEEEGETATRARKNPAPRTVAAFTAKAVTAITPEGACPAEMCAMVFPLLLQLRDQRSRFRIGLGW